MDRIGLQTKPHKQDSVLNEKQIYNLIFADIPFKQVLFDSVNNEI